MSFMKDRPAYECRTPMLIYNSFQTLFRKVFLVSLSLFFGFSSTNMQIIKSIIIFFEGGLGAKLHNNLKLFFPVNSFTLRSYDV